MAAAKPRGLRAYFRASRDPFNSVILVLPLFVAYQLGILFTGGIRNGVDFMTDALMGLIEAGLRVTFGKVGSGEVLVAYVAFNLLVLLGFGVAVYLLRKKGSFQPRLWPALLLESSVYALLFGSTIQLMMAAFGLDGLMLIEGSSAAGVAAGDVALAAGAKSYGPFVALIQSIGAGLYEEIVFRAGLLGGMFVLLTRFARVRPLLAAIAAIVTSSFIFSLVHHFGPLGDPFTVGVFAFRFFAGVVLSAIFAARGFAVAVYTHAIYDVLVMVLR